MRGTMAEEAEDHGAEPEVEVVAPDIQDDQADAGQEPESSRTSSDIEELAQEMGWTPKDKFKGDPERWKDAKTFVRTTVDVNKSLSKDVRELRDTTERLLKTQSKLVDREVEKRVKEATQRFNQAVADGDGEEAFRASEEIRQARAPVEAEEPPAATWIKENPWYNTHREAKALAFGICADLADQGKTQREQLQEARKAVEKAFPELFQDKTKPEPKPAPHVQGGQRSTQAAPRKKGWNDLPPAVRASAERHFINKGKCSQADYAETYWQENS